MSLPRRVIVGVGGGISSYKATTVVRQLTQAGFSVSVLPTEAATNFVGLTTWQALSQNPVYVDTFTSGAEVKHIELAREAELIVLVSATADLLAKIRLGLASDMLGNVLLAANCPVLIAPAMHTSMWDNPATQENLTVLKERGVEFLDPEVGRLSSGDTGKGRLIDPEKIVARALEILGINNSENGLAELDNADDSTLLGQQVLITTGGTIEPIDPVRYLGNRSSGLFGVELAIACVRAKAKVRLLVANLDKIAQARLEGLSAFEKSYLEVIPTPSAMEMYDRVEQYFSESNILIMAAAVADFRPASFSDAKIKKTSKTSELTLSLVQNPDILATFAQQKNSSQLVFGFAAETGTKSEVLQLGKQKAIRKKADAIFVNQVGMKTGFGDVNTAVTAVDAQGNELGNWQGEKPVLAAEMIKFIAGFIVKAGA